MSYYPEHADIAWNLANKRLESRPAPSKHQEYEAALFRAMNGLKSIRASCLQGTAVWRMASTSIGEIEVVLADRIAAQRKPQP